MKIVVNLSPFSGIQGLEIFAKNIVLELIKLSREQKFFVFDTENLPDLFDFPKLK